LKCTPLTSDSDISEYASPHLIPIDNLEQFIDLVLRTIAKQKEQLAIASIDRIIKEKHFDLQERLVVILNEAIHDEANELLGSLMYELEQIEETEVSNIEIIHYSILQIGDRDATVDFTIRFDYSIEADVTDYTYAFYDKEDNAW
jgi:hypothetical protein